MSLTYLEIEEALATIPAPTVTESQEFDDFLEQIVADAKSVLGEDWQPLESDPYMKHLRVIALRKLHDQADKNAIILELLVTTATGTMLDHLGLSRGVPRDTDEADDRYRIRIMTALARSSTAGAEDAYKWYAMSADSRIKCVHITSIPKSLIVDVYVYADVMDDAMLESVNAVLSSRDVRPLSDLVQVHRATLLPVTIDATVEVFDILKADEIRAKIEENFKDAFGLGMDFVRSDLIRKCHIDGVYRVSSDFEDIITDASEVVQIEAINLTFKEFENE